MPCEALLFVFTNVMTMNKGNFNEDAEETYRQQKTYAMTDVDLRSHVLRDVKHLVIPAYTRFLERYQKIPFTDHPDKYIKYDVAALEGMLGRLFDPASVKSSQ